MATYVGSAEAARILSVQPATLYAYVSRGVLSRRTAPDGRRSLYDLAEVEALATRGRSRTVAPRPSIDVRVVSAVTALDETGPRYRGHRVDELARSCSYEQVAELLWTGVLPEHRPLWPECSEADEAVAQKALRVTGPGLAALITLAVGLADSRRGDSPATAARRLLGLTPLVTTDSPTGKSIAGNTTTENSAAAGSAPASRSSSDSLPVPLAARLLASWSDTAPEELHPASVEAVDRAMVLLADHELTTSTIASRVAASARPPAGLALATGLAAVAGELHGGAPAAVVPFLRRARADGPSGMIESYRERGEKVPGFGHSVYRRLDPRFEPLMEAVESLPDPDGWAAATRRLIEAAGTSLPVAPNIDLGVGTLLLAAGLNAEVPLFAVARIAGLAAHIAEELEAPPLRYRGLARPPS